ncbi:4-aminobutyrate aminotransferase [Ameyamaea chiangmaiensis NBRC 103196]|uniref:Aminotransferase class III-fold pyridoxal phosphate-dependent enzyme n=1 Tax=Ameyamaea chiangmaiensis TaxID=442969 RepID=A0A850P7P0_9PROT|nr:aminotransferase class III-fold pyridoxal phosphate-dependent enzyme [Ameyamaea chiangmaiensis]MBS4073847.1 aminotransferase class III-fold pyridoxal phosphate-dependent enzyme [Ameyamaea chiangmaiensis]NVN40625.1 aminotransferase class III-fold pyridoxal phosphate-dependent enzyme [Ameyamaea chiangmaiensis]GBQ68203.1 4-aminobutyrate aminotransferase [Ameyamaea chiangmaiensis NBRC 103196]
MTSNAHLLERRRRLLGGAYRLFYTEPVHLVSGSGVWLRDSDGKTYLDAYNNVASVGHCHPLVVEALATQAATLNTHTRYLHEAVLLYAERLLELMPDALGNVMFTCTGSEANDLALRAAKVFTGGTGIIITKHAYHGVTELTAGLSPSLGAGAPPAHDVYFVSAPDPLHDGNADGTLFASNVRAALERMRADGVTPCALLVDTIFSSDGIQPFPRGALRLAADEMRAAGGVFIADEVQAGVGRTGTHMWGFARHGVVPDLVTMGKPLGDGHPIGAVAARPAIFDMFGDKARYFNTFGGNPVSARVGLAVLDVIRDEGLLENAATVGAAMEQAVRFLQSREACIADVRAAGLYLGAEIVDTATGAPDAVRAAAIVNAMRADGVLISNSGPAGNVLKIRPPLCFSLHNVDRLASCLESSIAMSA